MPLNRTDSARFVTLPQGDHHVQYPRVREIDVVQRRSPRGGGAVVPGDMSDRRSTKDRPRTLSKCDRPVESRDNRFPEL